MYICLLFLQGLSAISNNKRALILHQYLLRSDVSISQLVVVHRIETRGYWNRYIEARVGCKEQRLAGNSRRGGRGGLVSLGWSYCLLGICDCQSHHSLEHFTRLLAHWFSILAAINLCCKSSTRKLLPFPLKQTSFSTDRNLRVINRNSCEILQTLLAASCVCWPKTICDNTI